MTEAYAALMKCPRLKKIPERDRISTVTIGGYEVIVRNEDFKEGDVGLFIAVDSILPKEMIELYDIQKLKGGRVKTMKLKSVYSQGLFLPLKGDVLSKLSEPSDEGVLYSTVKEYENVAEVLGITKWKPIQKLYRGQSPNVRVKNWPDPRIEVYDIESIQRPDFAQVFKTGDDIVVTEKLHGMNATFAKLNGKTHVMSRRLCFDRDRLAGVFNDHIGEQTNIFYDIFDRYGFQDIFNTHDEKDTIIIRGEIFGPRVQDMDYGLREPEFRAFDISFEPGKYVDYADFMAFCLDNNIPFVPELYHGEFDMEKIATLAEQDSVVTGRRGYISEGVVIRDPIEHRKTPEEEGWNIPRRILKYVSKRYSLKDDSGEKLDV